MKGKDLMLGMGYIDEALIQEAGTHRQTKAPVWQKWGAMAACAVILFGAAAILPQLGCGKEKLPGAVTPLSSQAETLQTAVINMDNIFINELEKPVSAARRYYDPAKYDRLDWGKEDILQYFGKELAPAYVPAGLTAAASNGSAQAIAKKDGTIVYDTTWLQYYHDYYADGSPKLTEDVAATKGFAILASKVGTLSDCCYVLPEDEIKTSKIGGAAVTIGHRRMDYGPYHPQTNEEAGQYDLYVISFRLDGIDYEITSHQMALEEILKAAASVITGNSSVVIQNAD